MAIMDVMIPAVNGIPRLREEWHFGEVQEKQLVKAKIPSQIQSRDQVELELLILEVAAEVPSMILPQVAVVLVDPEY